MQTEPKIWPQGRRNAFSAAVLLENVVPYASMHIMHLSSVGTSILTSRVKKAFAILLAKENKGAKRWGSRLLSVVQEILCLRTYVFLKRNEGGI